MQQLMAMMGNQSPGAPSTPALSMSSGSCDDGARVRALTATGVAPAAKGAAAVALVGMTPARGQTQSMEDDDMLERRRPFGFNRNRPAVVQGPPKGGAGAPKVIRACEADEPLAKVAKVGGRGQKRLAEQAADCAEGDEVCELDDTGKPARQAKRTVTRSEHHVTFLELCNNEIVGGNDTRLSIC
jgi:hypothetical protein